MYINKPWWWDKYIVHDIHGSHISDDAPDAVKKDYKELTTEPLSPADWKAQVEKEEKEIIKKHLKHLEKQK